MFHTDLTPFGVDMERLAEDRLARLQAAMKRENLGALLLTDFLNIRYATNTVMMLGLRATGIQRFALIPAEGERVGVDFLNLSAVDGLKREEIDLVDGWPAINQARVVKTADELQLIRWTTRAKERGYDFVREALRESDPPEDKLSRIMLDYLMDQGFEAGSEFISIYDSSLADSRPHNEPMGADLVVRDGDLVICDATVAGPGGYYSDFARTFSHGTPTSETMRRYKEAYHSLQEALKFVKPGPCTEAFRHFGKGASARLPGFDS